MSDVTRILSQTEEGNGKAAEQLLPLLYHGLRKPRDPAGQSFQAMAQLLPSTRRPGEILVSLFSVNI